MDAMDDDARELLEGIPYVLRMNFKPTVENVAFERDFREFCNKYTNGGFFDGLKLLYAYGAPNAGYLALDEKLEGVKAIVARQVEELEMRLEEAPPKKVEKKTFG